MSGREMFIRTICTQMCVCTVTRVNVSTTTIATKHISIVLRSSMCDTQIFPMFLQEAPMSFALLTDVSESCACLRDTL